MPGLLIAWSAKAQRFLLVVLEPANCPAARELPRAQDELAKPVENALFGSWQATLKPQPRVLGVCQDGTTWATQAHG